MTAAINEPSTAYRANIAALAADALKHHELFANREDAMPSTWTCRAPGTGIYGFRVRFEPYMVAIWGDIGECILRVSDKDSLGWFVGINDGSLGYFVEKIRALDGPKAGTTAGTTAERADAPPVGHDRRTHDRWMKRRAEWKVS